MEAAFPEVGMEGAGGSVPEQGNSGSQDCPPVGPVVVVPTTAVAGPGFTVPSSAASKLPNASPQPAPPLASRVDGILHQAFTEVQAHVIAAHHAQPGALNALPADTAQHIQNLTARLSNAQARCNSLSASLKDSQLLKAQYASLQQSWNEYRDANDAYKKEHDANLLKLTELDQEVVTLRQRNLDLSKYVDTIQVEHEKGRRMFEDLSMKMEQANKNLQVAEETVCKAKAEALHWHKQATTRADPHGEFQQGLVKTIHEQFALRERAYIDRIKALEGQLGIQSSSQPPTPVAPVHPQVSASPPQPRVLVNGGHEQRGFVEAHGQVHAQPLPGPPPGGQVGLRRHSIQVPVGQMLSQNLQPRPLHPQPSNGPPRAVSSPMTISPIETQVARVSMGPPTPQTSIPPTPIGLGFPPEVMQARHFQAQQGPFIQLQQMPQALSTGGSPATYPQNPYAPSFRSDTTIRSAPSPSHQRQSSQGSDHPSITGTVLENSRNASATPVGFIATPSGMLQQVKTLTTNGVASGATSPATEGRRRSMGSRTTQSPVAQSRMQISPQPAQRVPLRAPSANPTWQPLESPASRSKRPSEPFVKAEVDELAEDANDLPDAPPNKRARTESDEPMQEEPAEDRTSLVETSSTPTGQTTAVPDPVENTSTSMPPGLNVEGMSRPESVPPPTTPHERNEETTTVAEPITSQPQTLPSPRSSEPPSRPSEPRSTPTRLSPPVPSTEQHPVDDQPAPAVTAILPAPSDESEAMDLSPTLEEPVEALRRTSIASADTIVDVHPPAPQDNTVTIPSQGGDSTDSAPDRRSSEESVDKMMEEGEISEASEVSLASPMSGVSSGHRTRVNSHEEPEPQETHGAERNLEPGEVVPPHKVEEANGPPDDIVVDIDLDVSPWDDSHPATEDICSLFEINEEQEKVFCTLCESRRQVTGGGPDEVVSFRDFSDLTILVRHCKDIHETVWRHILKPIKKENQSPTETTN